MDLVSIEAYVVPKKGSSWDRQNEILEPRQNSINYYEFGNNSRMIYDCDPVQEIQMI